MLILKIAIYCGLVLALSVLAGLFIALIIKAGSDYHPDIDEVEKERRIGGEIH